MAGRSSASANCTATAIEIHRPPPAGAPAAAASLSKAARLSHFFAHKGPAAVLQLQPGIHPPSPGPTTSLSPPPGSAPCTAAAQSAPCTAAAAQFAPLLSSDHRYVSAHAGPAEPGAPIDDEPPYFYLLTTYFSYLLFIVTGHIRDFWSKRLRNRSVAHLQVHNGYAPLNSDFDSFYTRRLKLRLDDCFNRPTTGVPGRRITLLDRASADWNHSFALTGTHTDCLNLSSYNYLGFAQSHGPCADAVEEVTRKYGLSSLSPRNEIGSLDLLVQTEALVAAFVRTEASLVFSMGFGTNATAFPALVEKGCLVISDEFNHSSIRYGARLSGCFITIFKHNDMQDLERVLREYISQGQRRTHRPWKKILVVVEGLYSMEGSMCNLPGLIRLKDRYKFYLYVDEAHSIGALGPNGRGVCDYFGIPPSRVDVLMGTLTKSFGASGGYIAGSKALINKVRLRNAGCIYTEAPSPIILQQIQTALQIIMGNINPGEGAERLQRLAFNSRYLRLGLKRLGFIVYGHDDSPVIPLLLYNPAKMPAFSHELLKRKIAVVVVGYPATPLVTSRVRFCVSAAHNKNDMDQLLYACAEVGDLLQLRFSSGVAGQDLNVTKAVDEKFRIEPRWDVEKVIACGVEDAKKTPSTL
ncbi:Serine palmitoyltransferase 2 [Neolecta irregularis DAH-3]|uniref:serine C-palmitoyltransferase n=1 Tax=Neolecta irregularis (strain DAH-3) TaxID=1198029 RepID=A0A1U7LL88_NEOID|nr:Serine palmitoyltransferase 2 [Neolecta irregularis DAH-3]|eukprot:OLL23417.1 Serine palmitoyltransferase 2 [Neolecta irregularis DAH-3]